MKVGLIVLSIFGTFAIASYAQAQTYPWCAYYSKGCTSCSFVTREQCMADVSGIGGFCQENDWYKPALATRLRHKAHTHP